MELKAALAPTSFSLPMKTMAIIQQSTKTEMVKTQTGTLIN